MSDNGQQDDLPAINRFWDCDDLIRRMRRIEGQTRGIQTMLTRGDSCKDILTQISAISGALNQVARVVGACGLLDGLQREGTPLDSEQIKTILEGLQAKGHL